MHALDLSRAHLLIPSLTSTSLSPPLPHACPLPLSCPLLHSLARIDLAPAPTTSCMPSTSLVPNLPCPPSSCLDLKKLVPTVSCPRPLLPHALIDLIPSCLRPRPHCLMSSPPCSRTITLAHNHTLPVLNTFYVYMLIIYSTDIGTS